MSLLQGLVKPAATMAVFAALGLVSWPLSWPIGVVLLPLPVFVGAYFAWRDHNPDLIGPIGYAGVAGIASVLAIRVALDSGYDATMHFIVFGAIFGAIGGIPVKVAVEGVHRVRSVRESIEMMKEAIEEQQRQRPS